MILHQLIFVFLSFFFLSVNSQERSFDLKQSIEQVLRNHKTILASKTDIEAAKFRIKQSKGGYFPSLDVTANYGHENIIKYGPGNNTQLAARDATAKITQTISDFGLTKSTVKTSRLSLKQTRALERQIKNEVKLNSRFIEKYLSKEIKKKIRQFLKNEKISNIQNIKILNLWVVRQFKGEYNPIHYHNGDLSGVGYIKLPKNMTKNQFVKNKTIKTNGTIDFINGQKNFLSKSIFNVVPKIGDLLIFPNYLMHTAYPFNVIGERRSFSFNIKIVFKKK